MGTLLQVREVARALGVHENTVRRWEQTGYIRAVRLPSGVRRFRAEDIEQVRARMYDGLAPLANTDDLAPVRAQSID
jgi:excisionase family DNA binding protein